MQTCFKASPSPSDQCWRIYRQDVPLANVIEVITESSVTKAAAFNEWCPVRGRGAFEPLITGSTLVFSPSERHGNLPMNKGALSDRERDRGDVGIVSSVRPSFEIISDGVSTDRPRARVTLSGREREGPWWPGRADGGGKLIFYHLNLPFLFPYSAQWAPGGL